MWLFMPFGFYSIVQKPGDKDLTVRARVRADLDHLRDHYMPSLAPTQETPGHDYRYRARATHADLAAGLGKMASELHYSNVKAETLRQSGARREKVYYKIHDDSVALGSIEPVRPMPKVGRKAKPAGASSGVSAYGGVVFNDAGQVLLVEPKNHFDNTFWTFPKGTSNLGETPEATALREIQEESGIVASVIAPLPGSYAGRNGHTSYFLMAFESDTGQVDNETESIVWVTPEEAKGRIGMTRKLLARERDLKVLDTAVAARMHSKGT